MDVLLRTAALDQVAGNRERSAREPDERDLRAELGGHHAHSLEDVGQVDLGLDRSETFEVGPGAEGHLDHGALPRVDIDARNDRLDRCDDVGEEDGGIHAQATDRLQRHLGGNLGSADHVRKGVLLTDGPVLGERSAGLAHEPDGNPARRQSATGGQERGQGLVGGVHA